MPLSRENVEALIFNFAYFSNIVSFVLIPRQKTKEVGQNEMKSLR